MYLCPFFYFTDFMTFDVRKALLLCRFCYSALLCLGNGFSHFQNCLAAIGTARSTNLMAKVECFALHAFRKASPFERVMGTAVCGVCPRMSHSYYHSSASIAKRL